MKRVVPVLVGLVMLPVYYPASGDAGGSAAGGNLGGHPVCEQYGDPLPQSGLRRSVPRCYTPVESNGW